MTPTTLPPLAPAGGRTPGSAASGGTVGPAVRRRPGQPTSASPSTHRVVRRRDRRAWATFALLAGPNVILLIVRTAVDQLADEARSQDWIRVFVPGADAILNDGIEQIVLEGTAPADAFDAIAPQIETAYLETVEPSR